MKCTICIRLRFAFCKQFKQYVVQSATTTLNMAIALQKYQRFSNFIPQTPIGASPLDLTRGLPSLRPLKAIYP